MSEKAASALAHSVHQDERDRRACWSHDANFVIAAIALRTGLVLPVLLSDENRGDSMVQGANTGEQGGGGGITSDL
jgi:hypothetical protein